MIFLYMLLGFMVWNIVGMPVMKKAYANALRTYRLNPTAVNQAKRPARPETTLEETLHESRCAWVKRDGVACNCNSRDKWIKTKNAWIDYKEWKPTAISVEPKPGHFALLAPLWPIALANMYISHAAKGIPDPAAVERMQAELDEMDRKLSDMREIR